MTTYKSMALSNGAEGRLNAQQKAASALGFGGLLLLTLATVGVPLQPKAVWLSTALVAIATGVIWYARASYAHKPAGIKNDKVWFKSSSARGLIGWLSAIALTAFYLLLYFKAEWLGLNKEGENSGLVGLFDPLSYALNGGAASQWFVYGTLYTLAILAFGIKFIWKYRHNRYEILRTASVMFFQTSFAFLIPEFMARLNGDLGNLPYYDLKNIWPLNYYNFEQYRIDGFISAGDIGIALLIFGVASILIITPILTYFYGKRWYCSWVCGCGGLAETAGDPYRHLSDKSLNAWKIERWLVHLVVVFVTIMTVAVVHSYLKSGAYWLSAEAFLISVALLLTTVFALVMIFKRDKLQADARWAAVSFFVLVLGLIGLHFFADTSSVFLIPDETLRSQYGLVIGAVFSGVIGVGFYPIMGNRVWCRFGCPMAAILGFQQKLFSRFRITTNGGQCISCGNCSTYCEMGIDVRAYAQKGQNVVRSSCVGCGVCSAVCPRGVLKLENGKVGGRVEESPVLLGNADNLLDLIRQRN